MPSISPNIVYKYKYKYTHYLSILIVLVVVIQRSSHLRKWSVANFLLREFLIWTMKSPDSLCCPVVEIFSLTFGLAIFPPKPITGAGGGCWAMVGVRSLLRSIQFSSPDSKPVHTFLRRDIFKFISSLRQWLITAPACGEGVLFALQKQVGQWHSKFKDHRMVEIITYLIVLLLVVDLWASLIDDDGVGLLFFRNSLYCRSGEVALAGWLWLVGLIVSNAILWL